jgi:cell division protein FtsI (penicillin-binding protein 3)
MSAGSSQGAGGRIDTVGIVAGAVVTVLLVLMLARVAQLQVRPSDHLAEYARERTSRKPEMSVRGDLQDRRGRLIAATRFGSRLFVDPADFPSPPDEHIARLAKALGMPMEKVGERIVRCMAHNDEVKAAETASGGAGHEQEPKQGKLAKLLAFFKSKPVPLAAVDGERADAEMDDPDADPVATHPKRIIRYAPLTGILSDEQIAAVRGLGLKGVHLEKRSVREYPASDLVASIVGKEGLEPGKGVGAELTRDKALTGTSGQVTYVRDASGRPLWIEQGSIKPAERGHDVRLSIDLEIQRIGMEELTRGMEESEAAGGRLIVLDPATGEILAMLDLARHVPGEIEYPWIDAPPPRPKVKLKRGEKAPPPPPRISYPPLPASPAHGGPRYITFKSDKGKVAHPALSRNRCIEDVYEPGSTFKPFVWSTITELGLARPEEIFDTEGGRWRTSYGRPVEDVTRRDKQSWSEVLSNSSNIGMVKGAERLTQKQLHDAVLRFGFGKRTGIELPGEASGIVTPQKAWTKWTQTSVAFGYEVSVTPIQMARAFSIFARSGELAGTLPPVRLFGIDENEGQVPVVHRVLPPDVTMVTREAMQRVAERVEEKMAVHHEGGWRYPMFGKSGTANVPIGKAPPGKRRPPRSNGYFDGQYNSSFVAAGPSEDPKLVVLCVIDDPGCDAERVHKKLHLGSVTAGPVVRRVMERSLAYLGVTPPPAKAEQVARAGMAQAGR